MKGWSWLKSFVSSLFTDDCQPKHIPPDIKHNRIPVSDMSFERPNIPVLIKEIEEVGTVQ